MRKTVFFLSLILMLVFSTAAYCIDITQVPYQSESRSRISFNNWGGDPFKIGGIVYPKGLAVGGGGEVAVTYELNYQFNKLTGYFGTDDRDDVAAWTQMAVFCNDQLLYRSPKVVRGNPAVYVEIPVAGREYVTIVFYTEYGYYSVLANAKFE
jgi:hypothetical protein